MLCDDPYGMKANNRRKDSLTSHGGKRTAMQKRRRRMDGCWMHHFKSANVVAAAAAMTGALAPVLLSYHVALFEHFTQHFFLLQLVQAGFTRRTGQKSEHSNSTTHTEQRSRKPNGRSEDRGWHARFA